MLHFLLLNAVPITYFALFFPILAKIAYQSAHFRSFILALYKIAKIPMPFYHECTKFWIINNALFKIFYGDYIIAEA